MYFDPKNKVVQLCTEGMQLEGEAKPLEAAGKFNAAWNLALTDLERFTAAHYVARHQPTVSDKLSWDEIALHHALRLEGEEIRGAYPSLYLNIAKCHEDLGDLELARKNYEAALSAASSLGSNGYGNLIRHGILNGLQRIGTK